MYRRFFPTLIIIPILLLQSAQIAGAAFLDVTKSHPNYAAIDYLQRNRIIKGIGDGKFEPDRGINRAEALKMIFESAGITPDELTKRSEFTDVKPDDWFFSYVELARGLGIVKGNGDRTFAPARGVSRAEMIKMLLETYRFNKSDWADRELYPDVPGDAWFAPYINYAGSIGLIQKNDTEKILPEEKLTRSQVAEIIYLMTVSRRGSDNQFLVSQAEIHISQIEAYVAAKNIPLAKRSSELAVDLTQRALKNIPDNSAILGAAKVARAYDFVMQAYLAGLQKNNNEAVKLANNAILKATEAWEINQDTQPIARHIKIRAQEIIDQANGSG